MTVTASRISSSCAYSHSSVRSKFAGAHQNAENPGAENMTASSPIRLLVVEDDPDFREMATEFLSRRGHQVMAVPSGNEACAICQREEFDVAIVDMNMPGMSGLEVLDRLSELQPMIETIMLTGQGSIETAVQAMKLGAHDYLTKPFPLPELERRCLIALDRGKLRRENRQLKSILARQQQGPPIIGSSPAMKRVVQLVERVAPTEKTVLITGESGTGKEVIAKAIHAASSRADHPLVTINCAALPEHLVESELFGHEKGSFTGATAEQPGLFEVADGGTLFIDELGELPLSLQPKLLRVLEDGSLRRVGSSQERRVNVRVIAATNRDLGGDVAEGKFREDLYYRVNVLTVELPPLRERGDDLWEFVDSRLNESMVLDEDARAAVARYHWPGNVRQLLNALDRALVLADNGVITIQELPPEVLDSSGRAVATTATVSTNGDAGYSGRTLAERERSAVIAAMEETNGNKAEAARRLGIHRRKLYRLLEKYEIGQSKTPAQ